MKRASSSTVSSSEVSRQLDNTAYDTVKIVASAITDLINVADNIDAIADIYPHVSDIAIVAAIKNEIVSIVTDKATIDSVFADKSTLDSLVADKAALDAVALALAEIIITANNVVVIETAANGIVDISTVATDIEAVIYVAANMLDVTNFSDVYYGPLAVEPTLRNDGTVMVEGDMYFDTTTNRVTTYTGTAWAVTPVTMADVIMPNVIGNPTHIDTFVEVFNHMYSAGIMSGCDLTDNLDGSISISAGSATIRANGDIGHGIIYSAEVPLLGNIVLTDNSANYVYISYNDGVTLSWGVSTTPAVVNMLDIVPAYIIVREGTKLTIMDTRSQNVDHIGKNQVREFYTEPFKRKNGGCVVSDAGTLHLACTGGAFYFQLDEHAIPVLDTTGTDTFEYYKHVAGVWTETDAQIIDNTNYDNGTDLVPVGVAKYGVHWIYTVVGITSYYAVVYGTQEYANIAAAQASTSPSSLPPSIGNLGVLLGRVIVQKAATELTEVSSAFTQAFTATVATDHEGLAGLLGGAVGDHVHLTSAEVSKLTGIEVGATADQSGSEIKTLYEAEADTNAYTDAEKVTNNKIVNTAVTSITFNVDGTITIVTP